MTEKDIIIQDLRRENVELRARVPKWISVNDRLPEINVRILTLDKWGHICDRRLYQFRNGFVCFSPDGLLPGRDITHWMPLPEPPKEEVNNG